MELQSVTPIEYTTPSNTELLGVFNLASFLKCDSSGPLYPAYYRGDSSLALSISPQLITEPGSFSFCLPHLRAGVSSFFLIGRPVAANTPGGQTLFIAEVLRESFSF